MNTSQCTLSVDFQMSILDQSRFIFGKIILKVFHQVQILALTINKVLLL